MKSRSPLAAGQVKLRGKISKMLSCGCCDVFDFRGKFFNHFWKKEAEKQADLEMKSRAIDRRPTWDEKFQDTVWPDSDFLYDDNKK